MSDWHGKLLMDTGREMREIPREKWPVIPSLESEPLRAWLSNDYLAVLYRQRVDGNLRLTVNRTRRNGKTWRDGITWDELQRVKNECLGPEVWCVENYPSESDVVNVSNMRHLFVCEERPELRFPDEAYVDDADVMAAMDFFRGLK